jgi:glycosyltransferase involved in cell wall biosynthesis
LKLVIQIPCLNEAEYLPATLAALPREVEGFDEVRWLIIDDGSTDNTSAVAAAHGVDYIVRFSQNQGLASAFQAGLDAALKLGADVIVNTDADNQYDASAIPALVAPILAGTADVVVGDRDTDSVNEFSWLKRRLQRFGTRVVQRFSGVEVKDATSGFRAFDREAAMQINLVSKFTYTIESLIQVNEASLALTNVPVKRNDSVRPSRLFGSTWKYIRRNAWTMIRIYVQYRPLRLFLPLGTLLLVTAVLAWLPWIIDNLNPPATPHIQSTILGAVLFISGIQVILFGVIADSLYSVRSLTSKTLQRVRDIELQVGVEPRAERTKAAAKPASKPAAARAAVKPTAKKPKAKGD